MLQAMIPALPKKRKFLLLLLLLCGLNGFGQRPADLLNKWSAASPIEKVYLHFDKDNYLAGETAWFKAYLSSDNQPDTLSTTLYVELLKDTTTLISRQVLPVLIGASNGQFELPDSLVTGYYQVRAYTASMLNQDAGFVYRRSLYVYGKAVTAAAPAGNLQRLEFFPEGGNLVNGLLQMVAFKITTADGFPATASGTIFNDKGEQVTAFSPVHDGMGMFELTPVAGRTYYGMLSGSSEKEPLPAALNKGVVITMMPHPQGSFFELKQKTGDPDFDAAYMIGQMQHHVVFRQSFRAGQAEQQGVINTKDLHSGILQVTVFNKNDMPLAERLCFVDNKEYRLQGTLREDTISFSPRARNVISLQIPGSVQGSFSVSVIDNEQSQLPAREENILTSFLLTSDLKGYIHNPAWYFSSDEDSVKTALDLVMMTNGWSRFKWTSILKEGMPAPRHQDLGYITLGGKVNYQGIKKPFSDKPVLLFVMGVNERRSTHMLKTDAEGQFRIDSLIFFGKTRLLFTDVRGKKSQYIDVFLETDSLNRKYPLQGIHGYRPFDVPGSATGTWKMDYEAIVKANGVMLEEIRLKSVKRHPLQEVDDRYTSGMFSGDASKSIDLVNSDEATPYQNIFDYLQARVNGLQISADGFDYSVFYRQGASMSSMGSIPMALFLDEIETDPSVIASIPASQIALVKVYASFSGAWGNAPGGVLALYTKKGQDYLNSASGMTNSRIYNGYSVIKEFYAPDYRKEQKEKQADNRVTLQWRPNLVINSENPVIPVSFFNNDRTKQYRIVVEGMTASGKLLFIEKVITPVRRSF